MEFAIALLALTAMEIVLGIDNIVFISIVTGKLPVEQQPLARRLGLILALVTRLALLGLLFFMVKGEQFQTPVFKMTDLGIPTSAIDWMAPTETKEIKEAMGEAVVKKLHDQHVAEANEVSWKDIILFLGGLFLVGKSVHEIHDEFGHSGEHQVDPSSKMFMSVLMQIALLDVVFSLDSVITAVGMVEDIRVMVAAIILAIVVMLIFAEPVSRFVDTNPTLKMLALSFLILIGVLLISEAVGAHIDKGYVYFAMFFAMVVEILNLAIRKKKGTSEPA